MKIAVSIPNDLYARAEREAKRRGVSRSKLYQDALKALIRAQDDAAITKRINESLAQHGDPADDEDIWIAQSQATALGAEGPAQKKRRKR